MTEGIAFITGAAGGIGRATAVEFAKRGFLPVVTDLGRQQDLAVLTAEVGGIAVDLDVADPRAVESAVRAVADQAGPISVAVCCAGFDVDMTLPETDDELWRRSLRVMLGGCVNVVAAISPGMKERGGGSFVLVSSELAIIGEENHVSYVTAKAAVLGFTRAMAHELGPHGIRVNSIAPGPTDTPMLTDRYRASAEYRSRLPLGRFGSPAELATAIADVAGQTWTTGQIISPNGGIVIQ
jgi:NAD(P)-dependent dehydrogenase (short-subunit alcohol dehydrogenase family)